MADLQITCHCGAISQTFAGIQRRKSQIPLCHCYGCRHSTGQPFTSYVQLPLTSLKPLRAIDKLTEFIAASTPTAVKLYFCSTCGCHIFRSIQSATEKTIEVTSGTLINGDESNVNDAFTLFGPQINIDETIDGGLSKWMSNIPTPSQESPTLHYSKTDHVKLPSSMSLEMDKSQSHIASCLCRRVTFQLRPPTQASLSPRSHFADLVIPHHTQDPDIKNPGDVKWWMRQNNTRFMAGMCACKSCRLVSGFEIQSWAFIPRVNIMFGAGGSENLQGSNHGDGHERDTEWEVVDFDKLHQNRTLTGYESSPGVMREFCPSCGATVFWHDTSRPELIDVSAGLMLPRATFDGRSEGARVELLLEWWTDRVSFAEDAILGRDKAPERRAKWLVETVQANMQLG